MQRAVLILIGVVVLSFGAAALAEGTMALGHNSQVVDDTPFRKFVTNVHVSPTPRPTPSGFQTQTPVPTPPLPSPSLATPLPSTTPVAPQAVTNTFVHLRSGASISAPIITDLNAGTLVVVGDYRDATWQAVIYNGMPGFVFRAYLTYK